MLPQCRISKAEVRENAGGCLPCVFSKKHALAPHLQRQTCALSALQTRTHTDKRIHTYMRTHAHRHADTQTHVHAHIHTQASKYSQHTYVHPGKSGNLSGVDELKDQSKHGSSNPDSHVAASHRSITDRPLSFFKSVGKMASSRKDGKESVSGAVQHSKGVEYFWNLLAISNDCSCVYVMDVYIC